MPTGCVASVHHDCFCVRLTLCTSECLEETQNLVESFFIMSGPTERFLDPECVPELFFGHIKDFIVRDGKKNNDKLPSKACVLTSILPPPSSLWFSIQ